MPNDEQIQVFDSIFQSALARGPGSLVNYECEYPKHEFLRYLVENRELLLHGSNRQAIEVLEPKRQTDYSGQQVTAVFASGDGIWPMFFAVVDQANYVGSLRNGCWVVTGHRGKSRRFYFFSLNGEMLRQRPWVDGMVYVLLRESFEQTSRGVVRFDEWASAEAVRPVAKVPITPADFPFLNRVTGHDEKESIFVSWFLFKRRQKQAGQRGE